MMPHFQAIFTLNARDNVMLEVIRDHFNLTHSVMHREIQEMLLATQDALASKEIRYADLKSALVPRVDHNEAGFLFDSQCIASDWYGLEVAKKMLPLFDHRTTQSVLCGDLIGKDQNRIFDILDESLILSRSFDFVHGNGLYCVYVNNLSDTTLKKFHLDLGEFPAYVGVIPATFSSRAKTFLSMTLTNSYLKHRNFIIMGHEDDCPIEENVNMLGYPFEKFGYTIRSLQSSHFELFLSYKIEREVFPGFEVDTEMSLNAVTDEVLPLADFRIYLETAKHGYLKSKKRGKLEKAGIAQLSLNELAQLIKSKIAANYIYNLEYLEEHNVVKFNLMIEIPRTDGGFPTRILVAMEYLPLTKTLRVITLH